MTELIWKYVIIILSLYGLLLLFIYLFQKKLVFEPTKLAKDFKFNLDGRGQEVFFETADGLNLHALHYKVQNSRGVILYLHGNASCLTEWQEIAEELLIFNFDVFIIDYRGYGKSDGHVSEKGMYRDAEAAYQYLLDQGYETNDIIIYGMSIGASVALELLKRIDNAAKGLVLEAPFASLKSLAYQKFPYFLPGLLLQYRFNNLKKAKHLKIPTLIMHGDADLTTPYRHSKRLYEAINDQKKLVIVPAGSHVNLPEHLEYRLELEKFFDRLDGKKQKKRRKQVS